MNRPWSLKQLAASPDWSTRLAEDYLFIMETDHLLLRAPPNTATPASPVAFGFYYMTYKYDPAKLKPVVERWHDPDQVGQGPAARKKPSTCDCRAQSTKHNLSCALTALTPIPARSPNSEPSCTWTVAPPPPSNRQP